MTLNELAHRSDQEHLGVLTWNGGLIPVLHLNARSRHISEEEVLEVYLEEISR